ncbi:putative molybdenum cofactor guanylyltransferase [compost metagenome]
MLAGVILAGGHNRRMGGAPKALMPIGEHVLLKIQLQEMAKICSRITIVTNIAELLKQAVLPFDEAELLWISDTYKDTGPMGGIHAASSAVKEPFLWVVGCDMPMISALAAAEMLALIHQHEADACVPSIGNKEHPLHAVYRRLVVAITSEERLSDGNYRLMGMLDAMNTLKAEAPFFMEKGLGVAFVTNINTPEDYDALIQPT